MIPKLRFPEFEGDWDRKKIKNCLSIGSGKDYKHLNKGEIPVYGTGGLMTYVDDFLYDGETVCIGRKGTIDNPRYFNGKIWTVDTLFYTNSFKETLPKFIYFIFQRINWKQHNEASGVPSLSKNTIESIKITLPTLPEQQKIASFFTAIDQKLTHLKRKKTLLEHYKKGVMQKIFAQEIRFKPAGFDSAGFDFAQAAAQPAAEPQAERSRSQGNYPNWERKRLGEIYTFRSTNSFSRENLNYEEGTVKNIHYGDIHTKFKTLFDINNEGVPYINLGVNVEKISSTNYCSTKDLVFADASEDLLDVGKCIEVFNLNNEKVLAGLHTILARPDKFEVALGFGGYLMKSQSVRKQIMKIAQGSKVSSISPSRLSDIELNLPSLPEQTKIANFLSAIDKKIEAVAEAIEATEKWKRGLMQRMFV